MMQCRQLTDMDLPYLHEAAPRYSHAPLAVILCGSLSGVPAMAVLLSSERYPLLLHQPRVGAVEQIRGQRTDST